MSNSQLRALQDYVDLMSNHALAHVARTANALGVLQALVDGQKQLEEIATACQLDPAALEPFLAALAETPLVERYGEHFALSQVARMIPPALTDLGDSSWQHLGRFVRSGQPLPEQPNVAATEDDYFSAALAQEWIRTPAAMSGAMALGIGQHRRGTRILELGCASAIFSLTFAHNDPTAQFVLVDAPERLALARRNAESMELTERFQWVEADYQRYTPAAGDFDLALLAGVLHRHDEATAQSLIRRAVSGLTAAGELCLVDVFPGQARGDRVRAVFELELSLRTRRGQLHSAFVIQDWLRQLGFSEIQFTHLPAPPYLWGLILAARPAA